MDFIIKELQYSVSWPNGKFPTPSTFVNDLKLPYLSESRLTFVNCLVLLFTSTCHEVPVLCFVTNIYSCLCRRDIIFFIREIIYPLFQWTLMYTIKRININIWVITSSQAMIRCPVDLSYPRLILITYSIIINLNDIMKMTV